VILVDDYGREKIVPWDPEEEIRQAIENEEMESDAEQETTPEQQTEYRAPEYDNKLDQAIHQAILDHFRREDSKNHFATASHVILDTEYRETSSLQDVLDGQEKHQYVVYAVTAYSEWVAEKEILSERWIEGGPAKMTFDVMSDGTFQLMGYWEPRGGEEYGNDLQYMFSSEAIEKLYDVELGKGMNYSLRRIQILYEQAVHGLGLDGEAIVAGMLDEIMATADEYLSAPSSEDPNWGQWLQHIDTLLYDMSYYGNYTLSYLYKEFLKGGQTDLRGEVMRIAMVRTDTYQRAIDYDPANGQEYFDAWLEHERRQMETMGADYMKQKCYSSWLALKLAGLIE